MEPFLNNAIAVRWEFRCQGNDSAGHGWDWKCRSGEGSVVAKSKGFFKSLSDALTDARQHGFQYELPQVA